MEAFDLITVSKFVGLAAVGIYAWQGLKHVVSKKDLDEVKEELRSQIEARVSTAVYDANQQRLDEDIRELKSDVKDIRKLLITIIQDKKIEDE